MKAKLTPREKLRAAIDHALYTRGMAEYWAGVRHSKRPESHASGTELKLWQELDIAVPAIWRALSAYTRAIRQEARKAKR